MKSTIAIGKEMAVQENDGTQYPMWVIQVDQRQYCTLFDDYDEKERNPDFDGEYCQACTEHIGDGKNDPPEDCDECPSESFYYWKNTEELDLHAGAFLTKKACIEHIEDNDYHYANPRTYCVSAWRNYEMQAVMRTLIEAAGEKVPTHYV